MTIIKNSSDESNAVEMAVLGSKVDSIDSSLIKMEKNIQHTVETMKGHLDDHIESIHNRLDRDRERDLQTQEMKLLIELEKLRNEIHQNTSARIEELDAKTIDRFKELKNELRLWVGSLVTVMILVSGFMRWELELHTDENLEVGLNPAIVKEQSFIITEKNGEDGP